LPEGEGNWRFSAWEMLLRRRFLPNWGFGAIPGLRRRIHLSRAFMTPLQRFFPSRIASRMNVQASDCENGLVPGRFQAGALGVSRGTPGVVPGSGPARLRFFFPGVALTGVGEQKSWGVGPTVQDEAPLTSHLEQGMHHSFIRSLYLF